MTYAEKLKHPQWQRKRLEIMQRDNFACLHCGGTETEFHIHHLEYHKDPWSVPSESLITLCKPCHDLVEEIKKRVSMLMRDIEAAYCFRQICGLIEKFGVEKIWRITSALTSDADIFQPIYDISQAALVRHYEAQELE